MSFNEGYIIYNHVLKNAFKNSFMKYSAYKSIQLLIGA